ncbi:fumarylacetoacetate hydrolase family protein [Pseudalkalibacillus hwajinpoensis]|uniref:Fumarylacetoacetate hydrolase family protein n=1 Tax=Guptibacillus hwajinpoensis TaxID=208199 RepID=A0A4U1M5A3_9BACL|nr:fumarylacetoacetate hydrolase family protein [Pseudalkalibacillus hwajinpoensis]TKD65787.1 fumarylacetoacetate hydrolase family protein [Pseudalkalibacillus hwajinpoensis]
MKFVTFEVDGRIQAGIVHDNRVVSLHQASNGAIPENLIDIIQAFERYQTFIEELPNTGYELKDVTLHAPIPRPLSIRDFYAFEEHVLSARGKRGLGVVPEWYELPVFYFSNHLAVKGPSEVIHRPRTCEKLDYELEIACVIGKEGRNIKAGQAAEYIFGFMIMNDWSARDLQAKEMKVGLGPAKGKDFATSFGPFLVTKEELPLEHGDLNLKMEAFVNGERYSLGNAKDMYYSFSEIIEQASKNVTLYPGEVIGSGTVGSGCILEQMERNWLVPGDKVDLSIDHLGTLSNIIGEEEEDGLL